MDAPSQDDLALYTMDDVLMTDAPSPMATTTTSTPTMFDRNEFSFLPQVQGIVQSILTGENSDEIGKAVVRLNERMDQARLLLQDLPGLQYVKEEQEAILRQESAILHQHQDKLKRYIQLPAFTYGSE